MDPVTWGIGLAAGTAVGIATGLIPGFHINTLAALGLGLLPAHPAVAIALVAAGVLHAFVQLIPQTYVGVAGDDAGFAVLPAHRLVIEGRGPDAVAIARDAALFGLAAAVLLLLPLKWIVAEPGRILPVLDAAAPWVVGGVLVLLVVQERHRGASGMGWAAATLALSGAVGLVALHVPMTSWVGMPASPLLPLLSGLFGIAGLAASLHAGTAIPPQRAPDGGGPPGLPAMLGTAAAFATVALPGLSSAVAASLTRVAPRQDDARDALATLSAINTAHLTLAFGLLWVTARARTGLASATSSLLPVDVWSFGAPAPPLVDVLAACLAAGLAGVAACTALERPGRLWLPRVPPARLNSGALAVVISVVAIFSGWNGLIVAACAAAAGLVPLSAGIRRVHLAGALLVPVLLNRIGFA